MGPQDSYTMATEQSHYPSDEGDETGSEQHNPQDRYPPCAESAHGGNLTPPLQHGAIQGHKQVEQDNEHDGTQDKPENLLCDTEQVKNGQQHCTGQRGLCFGID